MDIIYEYRKLNEENGGTMKKLLNKLKLKAKIGLLVGIAIFGIIIVGAVTIISVQESSSRIEVLDQALMPQVESLADIEIGALEYSKHITEYILTAEDEAYESAKVNLVTVDTAMIEFEEIVNELKIERLTEQYTMLKENYTEVKDLLEVTHVQTIALEESRASTFTLGEEIEKNAEVFYAIMIGKLEVIGRLETVDDDLFSNKLAMVEKATALVAEISNLRIELLNAEINNDIDLIKASKESIETVKAMSLELIDVTADPNEARTIKIILNIAKDFEVDVDKLIVNSTALSSGLDDLELSTNELLAHSTELFNSALMETSINTTDIMAIMKTLLIIVIATVLVVFAISIVMSVIITKSITKPINELVELSSELANGNLGVNTVHNNSKDEIGVLTRSFNTMHQSLKDLITRIHESSSMVGSTADQLNINATEATKTTEEVASTVGEIAAGATKQAIDTGAASDKMTDLANLIEKNTFSAKELFEQSGSIESLSRDGISTIKELTSKTEQSKVAMTEIFDVIELTNESAMKIGDASRFISSIAEQTNLLALNAAIEAARAGEAGKGFAVVADEIRKLAEDSAKSTSQIDLMLKELVSNATKAIKTSEDVKTIIEDQVVSVDETNEKYDSIAEAIHYSTLEIEKMANLGLEMEDNRVEVMQVVESLAAIAEENAASAEETAASSEEMLSTMEEVTSASEVLNSLASELEEVINTFKL